MKSWVDAGPGFKSAPLLAVELDLNPMVRTLDEGNTCVLLRLCAGYLTTDVLRMDRFVDLLGPSKHAPN